MYHSEVKFGLLNGGALWGRSEKAPLGPQKYTAIQCGETKPINILKEGEGHFLRVLGGVPPDRSFPLLVGSTV